MGHLFPHKRYNKRQGSFKYVALNFIGLAPLYDRFYHSPKYDFFIVLGPSPQDKQTKKKKKTITMFQKHWSLPIKSLPSIKERSYQNNGIYIIYAAQRGTETNSKAF